MTIVEKLVKKIMVKNQLLNPNQVANEIDMERSHLGKLMKGEAKPNAKNYLKMAKAAGWDLDKALSEIESVKEKGNASVSLLGVTALFCTLGLALFSTIEHCILCQIKWQLAKTQHTRFTGLKSITRLQIA